MRSGKPETAAAAVDAHVHAFKRDHGVDALEERFERSNVDYTDPRRPSLA